MSVIMSVMKTTTRPAKKKPSSAKVDLLPSVFTVRDMNRNTALVLAACRQHGRVLVKHRAGEQFVMTPVIEPSASATRPDFVERMRLHRERMREMGARGPTSPEGVEHLNKVIAGEL
jgi:hypothetical protein